MKNNIKKIIAMTLAAVTTISAVSTVFAEPTEEQKLLPMFWSEAAARLL